LHRKWVMWGAVLLGRPTSINVFQISSDFIGAELL